MRFGRDKVRRFDDRVIALFSRYGHRLHRISLGTIFIWFGLLKPFGHKTTTSLLAHTVYWGNPESVVPVLGWWEVAIGITMLVRPLLRVSLLLLLVRLPGTLLAFILLPDICFRHIPFVPTPEGQYLIKDLILIFAAIAIVGSVRDEEPRHRLH